MAAKTRQKKELRQSCDIPDIASSVDFGYVAAKLRGRHRKLYEGDRLAALARMRSLGDIGAELLGRREFVDHLDLERQLIRRHVQDLTDLTDLLAGPRRELVDWMITRYQAENIKVVLRGMASGEAFAQVRPYLVELPGAFSLDFEAFAAASGVEEVLGLISLPELAAQTRRQMEAYKQTGKSFFLETAIDKAYYTGLQARLDKLDQTDLDSCSPLIRAEVNIYNALAALRGRFSYGLSADDMEGLLARPTEGLSMPELRRVLRAESLAAAIAALPGMLLSRAGELHDAADVEAAMWGRLFRMAVRAYYHSIFDLGLALGFFYIKRVELMNLIRIVEMIHLRMPGEEIVRRLVSL